MGNNLKRALELVPPGFDKRVFESTPPGFDMPENATIIHAIAWLHILSVLANAPGGDQRWNKPHITSAPGGEIVFEWWNDPRKLTWYFNRTHKVWIESWGTHMFNEMNSGFFTNLREALDLLKWLTE